MESKRKEKAEILTRNCMHGHACSFFIFFKDYSEHDTGSVLLI